MKQNGISTIAVIGADVVEAAVSYALILEQICSHVLLVDVDSTIWLEKG